MGGAGAHGAWLEGDVEGAAGQAPAAEGGGCATDREQLGVGCGVTCGLAFVGGDGKDLVSPRDHGPDRNLALPCGFPGGEQGTAHHRKVGLGELL